MTSCIACGANVTGKKFCPDCGTPVQPAARPSSQQCPHCHADVKPGAAFCMHCGTALISPTQASSPTTYTPPPPPAMHMCPACHAQVVGSSAFCTNCGSDMNAVSGSYVSAAVCSNCGRQNTPGMRFCGGCGSQIASGAAAQTQYGQQPQYGQQTPYQQQYSQQPNNQYNQYNQSGYPQQSQQPMFGQGPQVLRCPVCQAVASVGTAYCVSCRTSLAGVVPTPANITGQQQQGGFLQGNNGKIAMGVLGGAAAVLGGEMLMHGMEDRGEDDMGYGRRRHHRREEGLLGGLEELGDDIGLF